MNISAVYLVKDGDYSDRKKRQDRYVADWNLNVQEATDDDCILTAVLLI